MDQGSMADNGLGQRHSSVASMRTGASVEVHSRWIIAYEYGLWHTSAWSAIVVSFAVVASCTDTPEISKESAHSDGEASNPRLHASKSALRERS